MRVGLQCLNCSGVWPVWTCSEPCAWHWVDDRRQRFIGNTAAIWGCKMEESSPKPTEDQARKEGMVQNWVKRPELPLAVLSHGPRWVNPAAGRWHCALGDGRAELRIHQCSALLTRTDTLLGELRCHSFNNKFRWSVLFGENTLCS